MTRVVAHRGNSAVAPQNTLAAFEAAARAGADSIELDVQLTSDGHVVVIHDDTLDATTSGTGWLKDTPLAAVRELDAGAWFAPAYAGQRVPLLAEVVELLDRHPSLDLLCEVKGVGPAVALDLKAIAAAALRMARGEIRGRELLSSWSQVIEYCRAAMAFEDREQFRILFLDKKNALIADEVQQTGTVDHTPVYPREVVRRALELSSTAVILVHNHPSGDPTPSRADIDMTRTIIETAKPLGIAVHDHIIIGKSGHVSMKGLQLI